MSTKICCICKQDKEYKLFHRQISSKDGYQAKCAKCTREYNREYRAKHTEKVSEYQKQYQSDNSDTIAARKKERYDAQKDSEEFKEKRRNLKYVTRYGITVEDYERILAEQHGVCNICLQEQTTARNNLCVDHCHITGEVRGLLCDHCNVGLGRFKDDPELLLRAVEYLKR